MINIKLTPKQTEAWGYLTDKTTTDILFGSGAGSGKSMLGCLWISWMCLSYPKTRYLIGRAVLTQLRLTTLRTLLEVQQIMGLKSGEHYTYNQQTNILTFYNGSEIILKDLADNPSDPQKDSLGSLEITAAFIDESSQISRLTYSIVKSRIRYKLNELGFIPKIFLTCNPSQNWLKEEFYIPWVKETLPEKKRFIRATAMDNPHLPPSYIETLSELPTQQRERLLMGNWDYTDEIDNVFFHDYIVSSVFRHDLNPNDTKYLSCDIARFGEDKTVVCVWCGLNLIDVKVYSKMDTVQVSHEIKTLQQIHGVHPSNIIIDSDGIGGGVVDQVRGKGFVNNSSPLHNQNFTNLKSQCYLKLADLMKEGKISINLHNNSVIETLTQELLSIKLKNVDKDTKIGVMSKEEQKKTLGRSPDYADAMMLRMYYELKSKNSGRYAITRL